MSYPMRYRQKDRYAHSRSRRSGPRNYGEQARYYADSYEDIDGRYYGSAKYDDAYPQEYDANYARQYRVGYPKYNRGISHNLAFGGQESPRRYDYSQYRRGYPSYEESRQYYDTYDVSSRRQDYYYDAQYSPKYDERYYPREKTRSRDKHVTSSRNHQKLDANNSSSPRYRQSQRQPLPLAQDEAVLAMETQHDKIEKQVIRLLQTRPVVYQFIEQEIYRIYAAVPGLTSIFESLLSEEGMQAFHSRLEHLMKVEEIYERLCDAIRVQHRSRGVPNIFVLIGKDAEGLHVPRRIYSTEEQTIEGFSQKIRSRLQAAAGLLAKRNWDQWYWKADSSRIEAGKTIHTLPTTQFATTSFLHDFNKNYEEVKIKWMNEIIEAWPVPIQNGKVFYPTAIVWRQKFGWACEYSSDDSVRLVRLDVLTDEDRARKKRSRHGKPQQIHFVHLLRLAKTTQVHMSPDELAAAADETKAAEEQKIQTKDSQTQHAAVRGNDFARHIRSGRDFWINSSRVTLPMCACEMQSGHIKNTKVYSFRCCRRVYCKQHADLNGFRCAYCRNYYHFTCKFNVYAKDIVRYRPGTSVCRYKACQKMKIEEEVRDALGADDDEKDEEHSSKQIVDLIMDFVAGGSFVSFPCSICNDKSLVPGDCRDCDSCYLCVEGNPQHYFNCETCGKSTCKLGSFTYGKKCPSCFEDSKQ